MIKNLYREVYDAIHSCRFSGYGEQKVELTKHQRDFQHRIQKKIAQDLGVKTVRDYSLEIAERVSFIKTMLLSSQSHNLVLGVSGGVDSLCAGLLCQRAVNELNKIPLLDAVKYRFVAVKLPYKIQADHDFVDLSLNAIYPDEIKEVNLEHPVDAIRAEMTPIFKDYDLTHEQIDFNIGNVKARMRMLIQYSIAGACHGLVVGTDHASEAVTGFFTKFGDGGFDFSPLQGLVKSQVRKIAELLGAPKELYEKVPTADLEDLNELVPDEKALGLSYEAIDDFLLNKDVSEKVFNRIVEYYLKTQHKRSLPTLMSAF